MRKPGESITAAGNAVSVPVKPAAGHAAGAPSTAPAQSDSPRSTRRLQIGVACLVAIAVATFALVVLLRQERRLAAISGIPVNVQATTLAPGGQLCRSDFTLPKGSAGVRFFVYSGNLPATPRLLVSAATPAGTFKYTRPGGAPQAGFVAVPLPEAKRDLPKSTMCIKNTGGIPVGFGGIVHQSARNSPLTVNGHRFAGDVAFDALLPHESLLAMVPVLFRRASVWEPAAFGPWTFYLIFAFGVIMSVLAVRLTLVDGSAKASTGRARRIASRPAVTIAALALLSGTAWAVLTPPWQAPDEMHHFEYVQYLAETGHVPSSSRGSSPTSSELRYAMEAAQTSSILRNPSGKPPWSEKSRQAWAALDRAKHPSRTDGGAPSSAGSYSPLYYAFAGTGYRVFHGGNVIDRLFGARLVSALLGGITAVFAWLFAKEVIRRPRWAVNAAALSVVLLPQFGFMSGAVNNDALVTALGTVLLYLVARGLRRGLTPRLSILIGLAFGLAFIAKPTIGAFIPAVGLALLWPAVRSREPKMLRFPALAAIAATAVALVWLGVAGAEGRSAIPANTAVARPFVLGDYMSYLFHFYVPDVLGITDKWFGPATPVFVIWMHSFFASFGWTDTDFPPYVYKLISAACIVGLVLMVAAAVRYRRKIGEWLPLAAFCGAAVVGLLLLVHYTFYRVGGVGEQGRYLLPLISIFGVSVAVAALGAGRRFAPVVATACVSLLGGLTVLSYGLIFTRYYT